MKVSEFIEIIQKKCGDSDPEIKFMAYRWSDDLEEKDYFEAWFDSISKRSEVIKIFIDT